MQRVTAQSVVQRNKKCYTQATVKKKTETLCFIGLRALQSKGRRKVLGSERGGCSQYFDLLFLLRSGRDIYCIECMQFHKHCALSRSVSDAVRQRCFITLLVRMGLTL
jgi:hypothetical protein